MWSWSDFELIVMNRFSLGVNVTLEGGLSLDNTISLQPFSQMADSNDLPKVKFMAMDGMQLCNPRLFNFPEIDMIFKSGQSVCGVQVPISKYHNMLENLTEMCDKVGWLTNLKKLYLLCLIPKQRIADSAQCNIPEIQAGAITVIVLFISRIPL